MTCRETLALDLAEFLATPTAPEFAAFRAHYPRCADCAAEVRAWTELHASLSGATHPSPDMLLQYQDGRLADADRHRLTQHLAACAPCRDELRALAIFDRDAAPAAARVATVRPRRWRLFPELPRLVLHPALASVSCQVDADLGTVLIGFGPVAPIPLAIPNVAGLSGFSAFVQALTLDGNTLQFAHSNALAIGIGL